MPPPQCMGPLWGFPRRLGGCLVVSRPPSIPRDQRGDTAVLVVQDFRKMGGDTILESAESHFLSSDRN